MELKTEYSGYNCTIQIDSGIVYRVFCDIDDKNKDSLFKKPKDYFFIQPKKNAKLKYRKLYHGPIKAKYKYNYELEYKNKENTIVSIPVKLSKFDLLKIKRQKKELLIQDKSLKIAIVVFILTNTLSFFGGMVYEEVNNESNKTTKADSEIKDDIKTANKILEPKEHLESDTEQ